MRAVSTQDDGIMGETFLLRNWLPKEDWPPVQASIWAIRAGNVMNHARQGLSGSEPVNFPTGPYYRACLSRFGPRPAR